MDGYQSNFQEKSISNFSVLKMSLFSNLKSVVYFSDIRGKSLPYFNKTLSPPNKTPVSHIDFIINYSFLGILKRFLTTSGKPRIFGQLYSFLQKLTIRGTKENQPYPLNNDSALKILLPESIFHPLHR